MEEYWKVVEECPSYLISNMGNVKNIKELKTLKVYDRNGYTWNIAKRNTWKHI